MELRNGKKITALLAVALMTALLLVGATGASASSQYYWSNIRMGTFTNLNGIAATDADHVWEAGGTTDGQIVSTANATAPSPTWTQYTATGTYLGGIFALDNTHVWASGGNAGAAAPNTSAILCWDSGSGTWGLQNRNGTSYQLNGGAALDSTHAWVCGNASGNVGKILYSNGGAYNSGSGGTAWVDDFTDPTGGCPIKAVSAAGSSVWAVGYVASSSDGKIFKRNGANDWTVQYTVAGYRLYAIIALDDNHVWAVGYHGTILSTSDGGTTWTPQTAPGIVDLKAVAATDMNHAWAGGNTGTVYTWNGTAWRTDTAGSDSIKGAAASDANHVYLGSGASAPRDQVYVGTPPRISTCTPSDVGQGQTIDIAITGTSTHFVNGSSVLSLGSGIDVNTFNVTDATHATANITVEDAAALGPRDVNITTGTETPDALVGGLTVKTVHTITVSPGAGGTISPPGPVSALNGNDYGFTINPNLHYHIVDVVAGGASQGPVGSYTFHNVTADTSISATFARTTHTLTVNVGSHGAVTPNGSVVVNEGDDQQFNVTPNAHYFATVSIDSGPPQTIASSPWTFTDVEADHTLDFAFSNITHQITVTVAPGEHGNISPPGPVTVVEGADQLFNINADPHYHVETLTVDSSPVTPASTYTFHGVTTDHSISVTFAITQHTITPSATGNGTISPNTPQTVNDGDDSPQFSMTPAAHYHLSQLLIDASPVPPSATYTFHNVTVNHSIAASFAIDTFQVNASVSGGHGSVSPAARTVNYGGSAMVNITPDDYYVVASITDNGVAKAPTNTYTVSDVTAAHSVVVTFALTAPQVASVSPTSASPGTQLTIKGWCFGSNVSDSVVTVGGVPAEVVSWTDTAIVVVVPEGASSGSVVVKTFGGGSNSNKTETIVNPTWYLAEGTTAWGFSSSIHIENPNDQDVNARVTYMLTDGSTKSIMVGLPKMSQTEVSPFDTIGAVDFSTKVECLQGKSIAVDRTISWEIGVGQAAAITNSIGVTGTATTWYLPEGSSNWGFETWLLIQNPNAQPANCKVTYMIEGVGPKTIDHKIAAHSRATFNMLDEIGKADASIKVESDVGVIPERSMYTHWIVPETGQDGRREGHDSIGTTQPANDYFLAEGSTAWGFTTYVLVQNPNPGPANVTLTYMTNKGPVSDPAFTMPPNSRKTIRVNDAHANVDLSTKVHADVPIVAERSMYWAAAPGSGLATHDSIGTSAAHSFWCLPDGYISPDDGGSETFTLVQNPNDVPVTVKVSYLCPGGKGNVVFTDTVPANSRKTYNMADKFPSGFASASILVESLTTGRKIIVERSMYTNSRWGGSDTIGGYSD